MRYTVHNTLELTGAHQNLSSTGVSCSVLWQNPSRGRFLPSLEHIFMQVLPSCQHELRLFLAIWYLSLDRVFLSQALQMQ